MREALTVIGFLIIVAFAALIAAPLYMDWNSWRGVVAQRMANAIGASVLIEGPIEARILPQPWLSVSRVRIGAAEGATTLTLGSAQADISLASLFRGDMVLSNVVIEQPKLSITADESGHVSPIGVVTPSSGTVLEGLEINNGEVAFNDPASGQALTISDIRLVGDARSFTGPFKADGVAVVNGVRQSINLSAGALSAEGLKLKLAIVPTDLPLTLEFDGMLKADDNVPRFEGRASLGRPPVNGRGDKGPPEEPWKATADLTLTSASALAEKLEIQIGPDESPLKFTGRASTALGVDAGLTATLSATQLELDRIAGVKPDVRVAPLQVLEKLRAVMPGLTIGSIPARIKLTAEGAMLGGAQVQQVKADFASTAKGWKVDSFAATLPGRTRLSFAGDVAAQGDGSLAGQIDLDARQASGFLAWMEGATRPAAPNAAQRLTLAAKVDAGPNRLSFSAMKLAVDDATAEGRIAFMPATRPNTRRVEADLTARRLNVDAVPAIAALMPGRGLITEADVRMSAQSLQYGGIDARTVTGHITVDGNVLVVDGLAIDDFGGASLTANGQVASLDATPSGEIRARLQARDVATVAVALKRGAVPPAILAALEQRASAMSPADIEVSLSFGDARRLAVNGQVGGSKVALQAELAGSFDTGSIETSLRLDSLDGVQLLRQLGLSPLPITVAGDAKLQFSLSGPINASRKWNGALDAGGIAISGTGKATGPLATPAFDGLLTIEVPDLSLPAQLFGVRLAGVLPGEGMKVNTGFLIKGQRINFDDMTGVVLGSAVTGALSIEPGAPAAVEGRLAFDQLEADRVGSLLSGADLSVATDAAPWPEVPFGEPVTTGLVGKIALTASRLVLGRGLPAATKFRSVLAVKPGSVALEGVGAMLADGALTGQVSLVRSTTDATLSGKLAVKDAALDTGVAKGRLGLALDFQGGGRTVASLVGSLTGGGTLTLRSASLPRLAPGAFSSAVVVIDTTPDTTKVDLPAVLETALAQGPFPAGSLDGSLALSNGVIRLAKIAGTTAPGGDPTLTLAGSLDLNSFAGKLQADLLPSAIKDGFGGAPPAFAVAYAGILPTFERRVDADALTGWASIRRAEREAKKLEALEAERQLREQAIADQKRAEAERMQKAIDDAKRLEAEKKAVEGQPAPPIEPAPVVTVPAKPAPDAPVDGVDDPLSILPPDGASTSEGPPAPVEPAPVRPDPGPVDPAPVVPQRLDPSPIKIPMPPEDVRGRDRQRFAAPVDPAGDNTGATGDTGVALAPLPPPIEVKRAPLIKVAPVVKPAAQPAAQP